MFKICVPRYIIFTVLQSIQIITYEPSYCKFDLSMQERTRCRQQRKQSPVQGIYLVWARKYIFSLKQCDHFLEIFAFQAKFLSFFAIYLSIQQNLNQRLQFIMQWGKIYFLQLNKASGNQVRLLTNGHHQQGILLNMGQVICRPANDDVAMRTTSSDD